MCAAGQGNSSPREQEVADLQVNNEALLCMLERERQHSQRLAEALQQAEANALEVSPPSSLGSASLRALPLLNPCSANGTLYTCCWGKQAGGCRGC